MKREFKTDSSETTEQLGVLIGSHLKGGECIEFESDLGGGKTTLVRGIVKGAGGKDQVSSPTFTISQIYECPNFSVYHFDFYRLQDPGLVQEELSEIINYNGNVSIIEWAESVQGVLPKERIIVSIDKDKKNENSRVFKIDFPAKLKYLLEDVNDINH